MQTMMKLKQAAAMALSLAMAALLLAAPALALEPDDSRIYRGIDVSVYQGEIDFQAVRSSGIEAVYIRAGEGSSYTDPYFARNTEHAKAAQLHYGFYLYVTARNEDQARTQAAVFAQLIQDTGYDCRPAMDFEQFSGMPAARLNAIALAFLEELERRTGVTPMVYTDAYAADRLWDEELGAYPLWVAEYGPAQPTVDSGTWTGWSGFQYADDGRVPGIRAEVDLDRFTGRVLIDGGEQPDYVEYTVRRGDTLWDIARRYGTTVEAIVRENAIADPNRIYVGQVLRIPVDPEGVEYTVRPGDTLWDIARRYGTTVEAIARENSIPDPNRIYVGQVLRIPTAR